MRVKKIILCLLLMVSLITALGTVSLPGIGLSYSAVAETTDGAVETPAPEEEPDPPSIIIQNVPASMEVGETATLSYTLRNSDSDSVTWRSSNSAVLSVDSGGKLTANAEGSAEITVTAGEAKDTVKISVNAIQAKSIKIVSSDFGLTSAVTGYEIKKGDTIGLELEVEPEGAAVSGVTWEVSDTDLARIDSEGVLTALDDGNIVVIANTDEGLSAEIDITIGKNIPWAMIAVIAAVAIIIIVLIVLVIRKKMKNSGKPDNDDDEYEDDENDTDEDDSNSDEEDEKKKKEAELERLRREAYEQGYKDREKEMTKVFDPKDFNFKDDDLE